MICLGYLLKKLKSLIYLLKINKNKIEMANKYDPKIYKLMEYNITKNK